MAREIQEELCVYISEEKLKFISSHQHSYENKKIQIALYRYNIESVDYRLVDHDQAEWATLLEMKNYSLSEADVPFIEKLSQL